MILKLYLTCLVLSEATIVVGVFDRSHRAGWIIVAFVFLGLGWLVESRFSRRRAPRDQKNVVQPLGSIQVGGRLRVSDQYTLSVSAVLDDLPTGPYSVQVETSSDANGCYVAALTLTSATAWASPRRQQLRVPVDTGFLILSAIDANEILISNLRKAHDKIISESNRDLDVELVAVGEQNVGIVTSTGFGDDIYALELGCTGNNRAEITCRFI
jgi:hypothetical protein